MKSKLLDRLLHRGTIEIEAVVSSVSDDGKSFVVSLPNTRNGNGLIKARLKRQAGRPVPKPGHVVYVDARIIQITQR